MPRRALARRVAPLGLEEGSYQNHHRWVLVIVSVVEAKGPPEAFRRMRRVGSNNFNYNNRITNKIYGSEVEGEILLSISLVLPSTSSHSTTVGPHIILA